MSKKKKSEKKFSVTLDPNLREIRTYDLFLIKKNDNCMEVQLASENETEDTIEIVIENIFRISSKSMYAFALEAVKALKEAEPEKEKGKNAGSKG